MSAPNRRRSRPSEPSHWIGGLILAAGAAAALGIGYLLGQNEADAAEQERRGGNRQREAPVAAAAAATPADRAQESTGDDVERSAYDALADLLNWN